eukprot:jgi/Ulvmu1/3901/UM018_0123.1
MIFCAAPAAKSSSVIAQRLRCTERMPYPRIRRCPPIRASNSKSTKVELEAIARDILEKENELKNAFQPGRPMPTGKQVAEMRAEVKALREMLATRLEAAAGPNAAGDDFSANKEISALITGVAAARARESMSAMRRSIDEAAGPTAVRLDDGTLLEEHEVLELEMLQLENEELRKKASLLLMRQHFLEELMHENKLAVPLPAVSESESEAEDTGYFMSSPSYY